MLIFILAPLPIYGNQNSIVPSNKLLIIVTEDCKIDKKVDSKMEKAYEIINYKNINYKKLKEYTDFAIPIDLIKENTKLNEFIRDSFYKHFSRVYLYGNLTISDYKIALGLDRFGSYVNVYNGNSISDDKAFITFSKEQETSYIENVIGYSLGNTSKNLIASISNNKKQKMDKLIISKIIIEDYINSKDILCIASLVKSGFNYRMVNTDGSYINMDFMLYKENDKQIPDYDFFAIKTNISGSGRPISGIETEHRLPFTSDEMVDYGPGDISRAGSVSVGLDFAACGLDGGGISYSFDVGGNPTIDATYNSADDYCTWKISRYWFLGGYLQDELFSLGSAWASTGKYAAIDVKFRATFVFANGFTSNCPWKAVQIRYSY